MYCESWSTKHNSSYTRDRSKLRNSQERIDVISQATTHRKLFHATGGGHLTDEDLFLALQKKKVKAEIKQLKKKKDVSLKMGDVAAKANAVLQQQKLYTTYTKDELSVLLMYHQVKGVSGMKKDAMVSKWKHVLERKKAAPACDCWSDADERRLMHFTSQPIKIKNTALGMTSRGDKEIG
eukprot:CCRYP_009816-RA/>CCRYP_009816-RA protein AED:0.34 eAED:0.38 QI:0/0/0/1/0/0/2/0/179